MARTTISLPDELTRRLARFRNRVNVSELCAKAIENELAALESGESLFENLTAAVTSLQSKIDAPYADGIKQASIWMEQAALSEIMDYVDIKPEDYQTIYLPPPLMEYVRDKWFSAKELEIFKKAWLATVIKIWRETKRR